MDFGLESTLYLMKGILMDKNNLIKSDSLLQKEFDIAIKNEDIKQAVYLYQELIRRNGFCGVNNYNEFEF